MIKVGMLGYGGIARSHRNGYEILRRRGEDVRLVAICDINPAQFHDLPPEEGYHTYTSLEEMLAAEQLDTVDICLPTYLHREYAVRLLEAGYNVQCEKPMGRTDADCEAILAAAASSRGRLLIGMCLRFEPMYLEAKRLIDEAPYGKVVSARFERIGGLPRWGFDNWYHDFARAGGVALDLHIHDVDMIRFLFEEPTAVSSRDIDVTVRSEIMDSTFFYPDKLVTATASWGESLPFRMSFRITFEKATIVMDDDRLTVWPADSEPFDYDRPAVDYMAEESLYLAKLAEGRDTDGRLTPADAAGTVHLVLKLNESADRGGAILPL